MLTFTEVCGQLRLSPKTVRKLIRSGDLKAIKVGDGRWDGRYRIEEADLADYLKRQTVKTEVAS